MNPSVRGDEDRHLARRSKADLCYIERPSRPSEKKKNSNIFQATLLVTNFLNYCFRKYFALEENFSEYNYRLVGFFLQYCKYFTILPCCLHGSEWKSILVICCF